jgi:hypothetical protein
MFDKGRGFFRNCAMRYKRVPRCFNIERSSTNFSFRDLLDRNGFIAVQIAAGFAAVVGLCLGACPG